VKFQIGKLYKVTSISLPDNTNWLQRMYKPLYNLKGPDFMTNPMGKRCVGCFLGDDNEDLIHHDTFVGHMFMFLGKLPGNQYHTQQFQYMHVLDDSGVWTWAAPINMLQKHIGFVRLT